MPAKTRKKKTEDRAPKAEAKKEEPKKEEKEEVKAVPEAPSISLPIDLKDIKIFSMNVARGEASIVAFDSQGVRKEISIDIPGDTLNVSVSK